MWEAWRSAIRPTTTWGLGPPGALPNPNPDIIGGRPWQHANNELLHAWTVGGLLGLASAAAAVAALTWVGVHHSDRDDRALASLLACCVALMGMEVLASFRGNWAHLGIVAVLAVAARSLRLMAQPPAPSPGTADHATRAHHLYPAADTTARPSELTPARTAAATLAA